MKTYITTLLLSLLGLSAFTQEILLEQDIRLQSGWTDKRDAYPIVDENTGEFALFILDNFIINAQAYNKDFSFENTYTCPRPKGKYKALIGHTAENNQYHLFFSNNKKKEFLIKTVDIENKRCTETKIPFKLKKEIYLETFSNKNKLYMLSLIKMSSTLKLRVYEGNKQIISKEFDFSQHQFDTTRYDRLCDALCYYSDLKTYCDIQKIENNSPNSLDLTSAINKLYCDGERIVMSLDHMDHKTVLISLNLKDLSSEVKTYKKAKIENQEFALTMSNSYLYKNVLYQIKANRHEMQFSAYDIEKDSLIKEYRVRKNEVIDFKNSNLIQENGSTLFSPKKRELVTTKQVLRKMASSNVGISVYETADNLEVTLGGNKDISHTSAVKVGGGGTTSIPIGNSGISHTFTNPTWYAYKTYTQTKSVYFKCLFDKLNLQHIVGDLDKNPFDKIKDFDDETKKTLKTQTIFKINDCYVFGYYDAMAKKYCLRKFE